MFTLLLSGVTLGFLVLVLLLERNCLGSLSKPWQRLTWLGLNMLFIVGVLFGSTSFWLITFIIHPPRGHPPRAALITELPVHDVAFRNSRGQRITAYVAFSKRPSAPAIILLHGTPGDRSGMLGIGSFLYHHDYSILAIDQQSYGDSDGIVSSLGAAESDDVLAGIAYLRRQNVTAQSPIGLLGVSMGAATASLAATRSPDIRAVVGDSTPATVIQAWGDPAHLPLAARTAVLTDQILLGVDIRQVRPVDLVRKFAAHTALLLITGTADQVTPPESLQAVFAAAHHPKQFWIVPGAGHAGSFVRDRAGYEQRVLAFFDTYCTYLAD